MIDFYKERDFVSVFSGYRTEHTVGGGHGVATAFNCQFYDVFSVKIIRVLGKACSRRMLNALIDRENRQVACAPQAAVVNHPLKVGEHPVVAVRYREQAVDDVGPRQVEEVLGDLRLAEAQKVVGLVAE